MSEIYTSLLESDYLCEVCKNLIYVDIKNKEEYCSNPKCGFYPPFILATNMDNVEKDLSEKLKKIKFVSRQFDSEFILKYLYSIRRQLISKIYTTPESQSNIDEILLLDDILTYLKIHPPIGRNNRIKDAEKFLMRYKDFFNYKIMLDDVKIKRIFISKDTRVLKLKYWHVFLDLYKAYGLTSLNNINPLELFKYQNIDRQKIIPITPYTGMEFSKFFQQNFTFILTLKYALKKYYITGVNYRYSTNEVDLATLLGLYFSIKNSIVERPINAVRKHFEDTCKSSNISRDVSKFVDQYIDNPSLAPIMLRVGNKILLDKETLLFYIFYLIGIYTKKLHRGIDIIVEAKQWASDVFEEECRNILRKNNYSVYQKELRSPNNLGYDLLGVSESKKKIIIGEAKYRDFSPSSINGVTLLKQELYPITDDGLYGRIIAHLKRVGYFKNNFRWFKQTLDIKGEINDYEILPLIINKFKPLIKKYCNIYLIDFDSLQGVI